MTDRPVRVTVETNTGGWFAVEVIRNRLRDLPVRVEGVTQTEPAPISAFPPPFRGIDTTVWVHRNDVGPLVLWLTAGCGGLGHNHNYAIETDTCQSRVRLVGSALLADCVTRWKDMPEVDPPKPATEQIADLTGELRGSDVLPLINAILERDWGATWLRELTHVFARLPGSGVDVRWDLPSIDVSQVQAVTVDTAELSRIYLEESDD